MVRVFLSIVRTIPTLVAALIATYIWGLGTMAGTFAIAVFTFAYVGKQLYEMIETVDMGAYEAMEAMGAGKAYSFISAIMPQVLPAYMSVCLFCFEGNVRYAAILGYVGAGGLGLILNEKISWREFHKVGTILFLLFLTVCVIESANRYFTSMIHSGQIAELFSGSKDLSKKICVSGRMILFGFTVLFLFCLAAQTPPDFSRTSAAALKSMAAGLMHPDWIFFFSTKKDGLGYLLLETICIAIVGTSIGAFLAAPLAFLNTRRFVPAPAAFFL